MTLDIAQVWDLSPENITYNFNEDGIDKAKNRIRVSEEEWLGRNKRVRELRSFLSGHMDSISLKRIHTGSPRYIVCLTKWNRLIEEEARLLEASFKEILNGSL